MLSGTALADYFTYQFLKTSTARVRNQIAAYGISKPIVDSNFLETTSEPRIIGIFMTLNNSKSCYINDIQIKPAKCVADRLAPSLACIFNKALEQDEFPLTWKEVRCSLSPQNSIKIVFLATVPFPCHLYSQKDLRIWNHADLSIVFLKHSAITDSQFGLSWQGKSTKSSILLRKEIVVQNSIEKCRLPTLNTITDFCQSVTSRLWHAWYIFLTFSMSPWKQKARFCRWGISLSPHSIKRGEPQDNILGPLLINVYFNDTVNINHDVSPLMNTEGTGNLLTPAGVNKVVAKGNNFFPHLRSDST